MENQATKRQSLVLLIDRQRPLIRFRSIGVDGDTATAAFYTIMPPDFHKYSFQNSSNNFFCFAKNTCDSADSACLLDLAANKVITLPESLIQHYPPSGLCRSFYGVGFDSRAKHHKTLRIDLDVHSDAISAQVNTLGEDTWRSVKGTLPSPSIFRKPVAVDGALVWIDLALTATASKSSRHHHHHHHHHQQYGTVFNMAEEKFSSVPLPEQMQVGHLVALNDQLCAVDLTSASCIDIWVLRDLYAETSAWDSLCRIKMMAPRGAKDHSKTRVLGRLEKSGQLLLKSYGAYFMYEAAAERLEYVHLPLVTDPETEVHCYNGSFIDFLGAAA